MSDLLDISHHFAGGVYAKRMLIPAGVAIAQHLHRYDHLSVLAAGTVELEVDGIRTQHTAPACLTIKANAHHGIRAVTDAVWFCIHATECEDASAVDAQLVLPSDPQVMRRIAEALL